MKILKGSNYSTVLDNINKLIINIINNKLLSNRNTTLKERSTTTAVIIAPPIQKEQAKKIVKSNKTIPKIPPITKNFAKNDMQEINKIVSKINVTSPSKKKETFKIMIIKIIIWRN